MEYSDPAIMPRMAYTVCERNRSRQRRMRRTNTSTPAATPAANTRRMGRYAISRPITARTAPMMGTYRPNISSSVEPEMPGSTMAVMATMAAKNT